MIKKFLNYFLFALSINILALCLLGCFRIMQLIILSGFAPDCSWGVFLKACMYGIWYDNVIGCYILLLPVLFISLELIFNKRWKYVEWGIVFYLIGMYTVVFALSAANIPFYQYFLQNINVGALGRMENDGGLALGMILEDSSYYIYFFVFLLFVLIWGYSVLRLKRKFMSKPEKLILPTMSRRFETAGLCLLMLVGCFVGIRGGVGKYPIKLQSAYFCDNLFLNQSGIAPSFNFMKSFVSWKNDHTCLMEDEKAIALARNILSVKDTLDNSSIARHINGRVCPLSGANVVLVLMESMSADWMERYGNKKNLTPNLDRLSEKSLYFDNFFSSGEHTNQGIFCTLTSYPAIFNHTVLRDDKPFSSSLGGVLNENGYRTLFFIPHDKYYDNLFPFLRMNGFGDIYSQDDYERDAIVNTWGVPDDYLYSYALQKMDELSGDKPFLASILTVSNHPPYIIPKEFQDASLKPEEQIVRYADAAIGKFLEEASARKWYERTVFVFVADHGKAVNASNTEIPISYHHTPLIIYSPLIEKEVNRALGCQLDVTPTILGLLGIDYTRNSFGIDLLREQRPFAYFTADGKLGCIDNGYYYIYDKERDKDILYKREGWDFTKIDVAMDSVALKKLKEQSFALFQTSYFLRDKRKM